MLNRRILYDYDDASNRTRMRIQPAGGGSNQYDVQYAYDELNRMVSTVDGMVSKTATFSYSDVSKLESINYPNGTKASFTLDNMNRLDLIEYRYSNNNMMCKFDYGYDTKSNVTSLQRDDTGAGGSVKNYSFTYDGISRLMTANYGNETVSYTYDNVGNRLSLVSSISGTTNYTIATDSDQLIYRSKVPEDTTFSNMSYTYDAEGNLTQRGSGNNYDTFSFSAFAGMVKQVQKVRGGSVQQTIQYSYDGMGQRVKTVDSQGTKYYLYEGNMPLLELDASKNITSSYVYGTNGVIYRRIHAQSSYEYHYADAIGSVALMTDNSQNVIARYEYDVFGSIRFQSGSSNNTRKFTGKEYDIDIKLYYFGARYYDPYIGRFISRDPAGQGINWYVYCDNNPLAFVDPSGCRKLYTDEIRMARVIFGDTIDYNQVTLDFLYPLYTGSMVPFGSAIVTTHSTAIPWTDVGFGSHLMHELTHVWQYQNSSTSKLYAKYAKEYLSNTHFGLK